MAYGELLTTVIVTGRRGGSQRRFLGIDKRVTASTDRAALRRRPSCGERRTDKKLLTLLPSHLAPIHPDLTITHCAVLAPTGHTLGFMTFAPTKTTSQGMI